MLCLSKGILENAIKITNEPPTGMHANLHAALDNFDQVSATVLVLVFGFYKYLLIHRSLGRTSWNSAAVSKSLRPSCSRCVIFMPVWQRGGSLDHKVGIEYTHSVLET